VLACIAHGQTGDRQELTEDVRELTLFLAQVLVISLDNVDRCRSTLCPTAAWTQTMTDVLMVC